MARMRWACLRAAIWALLTGGATRAETPFRVGVVEDMSGVSSGNGGPAMVPATWMALKEFGGTVLGRPIEVLAVDNQNNPDLDPALARQPVDDKHVSTLVLGGPLLGRPQCGARNVTS